LSSAAFQLLFITDGFDDATCARVACALGAVGRGVAAVQLRAKTLEGRALHAAAAALAETVRQFAAPLLVNERADVALAVGAAGVHLPARGLDVKNVRRWAGRKLTVGVSTHTLAEARMAERGGADYVVFGPVFASPQKGAPVGVEALAEVVRALSIPVFALGGVDATNARACVQAGARVACIGAVLGRDDAAAGARALDEAAS
jgi:thiamine-phosphate pyrophosphorylase